MLCEEKHDRLQEKPQWLKCTLGALQTREKRKRDGELRHANPHSWADYAPAKHSLEHPWLWIQGLTFAWNGELDTEQCWFLLSPSVGSHTCSASPQLWPAWAYHHFPGTYWSDRCLALDNLLETTRSSSLSGGKASSATSLSRVSGMSAFLIWS